MFRHAAPDSSRPFAVLSAAVVVALLLFVATGWWVWRDLRGQGPVPAVVAATGGLIRNGSFDTGTAPWASTEKMPTAVVDGRLCADVPADTTKLHDVSITQTDLPLMKGHVYEWTFTAAASTAGVQVRTVVGLGVEPYDTYFQEDPALGSTPKTFAYTFVASADTMQAQVAFQVGGNAAPWRFCLDDVSLRPGGKAPLYRPDTGPRVRVNQVAYLVDGPKDATVVTPSQSPRPWQLKDAGGTTVAQGRTVPHGTDASSGENTHTIDFSSYRTPGTGFTLTADGDTSHPFDIGGVAYWQLARDSLKFYYTQRSGIEIQEILRPGFARPAGHLGEPPNSGDTEVRCRPKGCDGPVDVRGGWYDGGDHGKYVVGGGIAVWQLLSRFERSRAAAVKPAPTSGDGLLAIPESDNDVPDILDEARWELEFMLRMQVPAGEPQAGMVHHKVHDESWTDLPLLPSDDPQRRELRPPSTAATLNLAAVAAKAARAYAPYDRGFADRCRAAAELAWRAASAHPREYAPADDDAGGSPYDDSDVSDEFYWAAAELYLTTGDKAYAAKLEASRHHTGDVFAPLGFNWKHTAALGRLAVAVVPNDLPDVEKIRASVVAGADGYLKAMGRQAYGMPYAPPDDRFDWGSNSEVLDNTVVLATAYDLTAQRRYADGVLRAMGYILGRNALNLSYVTGYGDVYARNQHSRWYAHQLDPKLPEPPHGTLAGGPNSSIEDQVARAKVPDCVGQFCYVDDIRSVSTNELRISWNSALAWVAAFVASL